MKIKELKATQTYIVCLFSTLLVYPSSFLHNWIRCRNMWHYLTFRVVAYNPLSPPPITMLQKEHNQKSIHHLKVGLWIRVLWSDPDPVSEMKSDLDPFFWRLPFKVLIPKVIHVIRVHTRLLLLIHILSYIFCSASHSPSVSLLLCIVSIGFRDKKKVFGVNGLRR